MRTKGVMMEHLVLAVFEKESETYQAFSQLKNDSVNSAYSIIQMAVVAKQEGAVIAKDSYDSGIDSTDDTWKGGLIGLVVGILGGPLGVLLGGATGALIGSAMDASDTSQNSNLLLFISDALTEGQTGLVFLVDETDPSALNLRLDQYNDVVTRWDADQVAADLKQAQEVQENLRREARKQMKEQKRAAKRAAREAQ